jgi:class 3 adenylate cyclase/CHASE2 domain-containing sensor protein
VLLWVFCYLQDKLSAPSKIRSGRTLPVVIPACVIFLVCLAQLASQFRPGFNLFRRLEWMSYDWRIRLAAGRQQPYATNLLAAAFVTDRDLKEMNDGSFGYREKFPWPTHYYGRVVRELANQGATTVGFDILFELLNPESTFQLPDKTATSSDEFFAAQLRKAGNVLLAAEGEGNIFPAALFRTNALAVGNIFSPRDADGVLRRAKLFSEFRVWHPEIQRLVRPLDLDLSNARMKGNHVVFPRLDGEPPHEIPLNKDGSLRMEELTGKPAAVPQWPYKTQRIWNLGIIMAARTLGLDLNSPILRTGEIILYGTNGVERRIPVDGENFFYVNWTLRFEDRRIYSTNIVSLIRSDHWRAKGSPDVSPAFKDKLVVIGSTGTGGNIADRGTTPLDEGTPLVMKHLNVANSIITGQFIRGIDPGTELLLIVVMGITSAFLTWKLRTLAASFAVVTVLVAYTAASAVLFLEHRYWLPLVLPLAGGLVMNHVCLVTYRVLVEQKERHRIKSVFSKIVSPNVVNELLKAESVSLGGARRRVTVFFADVRGFTRVTDENQAKADEYIRAHQLPPSEADAYLDEQARDVLTTVNLYLGVIADTVKKHNGTLDKYIGDCVMAFWGAPAPSDRQALDCVRAAIDSQRAIYQLNLRRALENKRREEENKVRQVLGRPPTSALTLLALGSGINTGMVTVGLMGSDAHILNYTVFGREVNLASRLEGVSGRGRIIVSDTTYQELKRLDLELAAKCIELPPHEVKGFRDPVKIFEVQWREIDTEMRTLDTSILTGARDTLPTDFTAPSGRD